MTTQRLAFAAHTAHLNPMTGDGVLVLPNPAHDVPSPVSVPVLREDGSGEPLLTIESASLFEADWNAAIGELDRLGWEPTEGEDGDLSIDGYTADGCQVIGLYGREPVISEPSIDECIEAWAELTRIAGVIRQTP